MNIFEPKFTSREFADKLGVTTENLRDWRRRGLDLGLGVAVNDRKMYSLFDVFESGVMNRLRYQALDDLKEAFRIARRIAPIIAHRAGYSLNGYPYAGDTLVGQGRFLLVTAIGEYVVTNDIAEAATSL